MKKILVKYIRYLEGLSLGNNKELYNIESINLENIKIQVQRDIN